MARTILEQVENCRVYDDGTILVQNVRFSYPHIGKPWAKNPDKETLKYGVVGLLPKTTHKAAAHLVKKKIDEILTEKNKGQKLGSKDRFLRNGDDSSKETNAGCYTINASETKKPSARGKDTRPVAEKDMEELFYGGAWGDILIRPWFQDHKEFGKKVNAGLVAIQFKKHDEPFGEGRISEEDIDDTFDAAGDDDSSGFSDSLDDDDDL